MTKECWLFLNCKVMTGYHPNKCPNYKNCKNNALNSINRVCALPYERFFKPPTQCLYVIPIHQSESQSAGWHPAMKLPYEYEPGKLEVGWNVGGLCFYLEDEAVKGGYQIAEDLPYTVMENPKQLLVKQKLYKEPVKGGWGSPVDLPMRRRKDPSRWEVDFDYLNPDYKEAIAAGWHPAERIDLNEIPL